jgi:hypothetical protein
MCYHKYMNAKSDPPAKARGRPRLPEGEKSIPGSIRLTPERWEKLRVLGMAWLSKAIDRARGPER